MAVAKTRLSVPRLEGWETLSEAADALGLSRWMVHKMCDSTDPDRPAEFKTVRYIGDPGRPVYLVRTEERKALGRRREREDQERAQTEAEAGRDKVAVG